MLKTWIVAACLAMPLVAVGQTTQQNKMTACNKDAGDKNLSGDARKAFMSQCLSADGKPAAASAGTMTQQDKMTACNKQAGDKKLAGDDRKKFMSSCLSG